MRCYLVLSALALLGWLPAAALTVRVESPQGAPRLVVDGEAVRARMFYGGPGWSALPIGPEGKQIEFEFTATGSAENGTMHFRFGPSAGVVRLDDLQVTDLNDQHDIIPVCDFEGGLAQFEHDWTHWPVDAAVNTVGTISVEPKAGRAGSAALQVKLVDPPEGKWPDFHLYHLTNLHLTAGHRYRVRVWAQAIPARSLNIEFHRPGKPFVRIGGPPDPFVAQIKLAAQAGVNFVTFPVGLPWPAPGEPVNWEGVDTACQTVLNASPQALLIPRVPMNPPDWWRAAHPDEVMQWEDGHRAMAVPASPLYRKEAAERLTAFIQHVEEKFGDHVAGYHPDGQNTGEWFYEDTWKALLNGYAPADLTAWRLWLKKTYATDAALRTAWKDPAATLETVAVPTAVARHAAPGGIFRDAATEQAIIDWGRFQQDAMAGCVCELAHAAREASQGRKLVLFFYGYVHELAGVMNGPATSGHFALRQVLDSPDIDVLCSPIAYFDRGLGGSSPSMTAAESVALAGKMWLNEDDTHTYIATGNPPGYLEHVSSLADTNGELTRNVAQEALRNFATWWMDLTQTGWFNDPGMWAQMARLKVLDEALLKTPMPFKPEIAVVVDEAVMMRVAAKAEVVTRPAVYAVREQLGRMGAPYGQYLLDDVIAGKVKAKMYVFLNAWSLTAGQRESLRQATRGSVCVWCYVPGYYDGNEVSATGMQQLTGFDLRPLINVKAMATPTAVGMKAGFVQAFGVPYPLRPQLAVADAKPEEVLGTYPDGSAALVLRKRETGASLFAGAPGLTTSVLRLAAKQAGVHLYCNTVCNVYANGPFIALHAAQDGPVELDTGSDQPVTDLITGVTLGQGPKVTLSLKRGETRVLRVGK